MIFDASSFVAFRDFGDKYHYVKDQFGWVVLGLVGLTFFSYFDYHKLYALSLPILCTALVLLILVFVPGIGIHILGASRWINAGAFTIQPAEFVSLLLRFIWQHGFRTKKKGDF